MEMDSIDDEDLDEVDREYHRLVPEYNQLIDYLQQVSRRFLPLQQQFTEEQVRQRLIRPSIDRRRSLLRLESRESDAHRRRIFPM